MLGTLGWDEAWEAAFEPHRADGLVPGRVAIQHRIAYDVLTDDGEVRARLPGRVRHSTSAAELPVVGDWVGIDRGPAPEIRAILPRRTKFSRRAAHDPGGARFASRSSPRTSTSSSSRGRSPTIPARACSSAT